MGNLSHPIRPTPKLTKRRDEQDDVSSHGGGGESGIDGAPRGVGAGGRRPYIYLTIIIYYVCACACICTS